MLYQRLRRRRHTLSLGRRRVTSRTESSNDDREKLSLQEPLQGDEEEDEEGQTGRKVEDEALRLLLIHADKFEYETKEKAVKEPEPLSDGHRLLALNRRFDILLGRAIRLGMGGIDSGSSHREFS